MRINSILNFYFILILASTITACGGNAGDTSGEFEYVAIGASDAVGIGASPLDNGYVYRIQQGLKEDGKDVGLLNLGIPDANLEAIDEFETPVAIEDQPELITIFVGANDIIAGIRPDQFQNDLNEMLTELRSNTQALIVIATIPNLNQLPRFRDGSDDDVTAARIAVFNDIIVSEANSIGAAIVDLASQQVLDSEVSDDGLHPNNQGYVRIADAFLAVIRQNLN